MGALMFAFWVSMAVVMIAVIEFKGRQRRKAIEAETKKFGKQLKKAVANAKNEGGKNAFLYYALVQTRIQMYM